MPQRILFFLLCIGLFATVSQAQTTVTYDPDENDTASYDSTGNPLTLSVASGSATQSGALSGTGNVTKTGVGTLTLTGTHDYTGDTTVNGGTLAVDGSSSAISDPTRIYVGYSGDGTLSITNGGQATPSSFVEMGHSSGVTGTLTIDGANSQLTTGYYLDVGFDGTGNLNITNGGSLTTSSFARFGVNATGVGTGLVSGTGSELNVAAQLELGTYGNGTLTIASGGTVTAQALHFDRLLTGSGTLNLNSGGTLVITSGGIVNYGDPGDASLNLAGGTLKAAATGWSTTVAAVLTNTNTVNTNGVSIALNGDLSGTGGLAKIGAGTLTLGGTNTYDGGTSITGGLIEFSALNNFGSGNITLNGGGLRWAGSSTTDISSRLNAIGSSGATFDTNSNDVTLTNALTGSGAVTKQGNGVLTLSGTNSYEGGTSIMGGLIEFSTLNNFGPGNITLNGGGLRWADGTTTDVSSRLNAIGTSGGTFDTNGNDVTLASDLTGTGVTAKQGSGTLTLSGTDSFGAVAINGGTLALTSGGTLQFGGGNSLTASNGGTLALSAGTFKLGGAGFSMYVPTALTGTSTFDTNGYNGGIYGPLSGTGGFTKTGSGVLTVTNNNTFSGAVTVNAGTLVVNTAPDLGTGNGDVTVNAGAALAAATSLEFARNVTATGTDAIITSPNHLEVGSAGDGAMTIGNGGLVGSGTTTTLAYYGGDTGTIEVTGTNSTLYAQSALRVGYGGTGTLTIGSGGTANAQNLILAAQSGSTGTINVNTGGTLQVGGTDGITIGGGTGTFNLAGGTLKVGGDTRVAAAPAANTIDLTNLPTEIGNVIAANTPQTGDTGLTTSVAMNLSNASTIDTSGSAATLSGVLSGSGSLTKSGAGTLRLSGANNYSGGTTVSAGTLVGNTTSLQGNITNNAAVVFEQDSVDTYAGTISGSGTLTKSGTGTLYLNAPNTYTGATIINAGTLRLGEALPFASTSITVNSGASLYVDADSGFTLDSTQTLGGTGTISGGLLTLGSGATLAPGNSPGTLTFTNGLTLDAGAILNFELGSVSDLIAVTGGTLTGPSSGTVTLNLSDSGGFTAGTYTLFDYTSATLSDFDITDFALGTTIAGYDYSFNLTGSALQLVALTAVPEPSTYAIIFGLGACLAVIFKRRRMLGFALWRRRVKA